MRSKLESATIHDVAREANTSIATVSRVLSGSNYPVSAVTRQRVLESAQRLSYKNHQGKSFSVSVPSAVGVIIPTLTNPFYNELIMGIENECERQNFSPLICSSRRDPEREIRNVELLLHKNVQGLIVSSLNEKTSFPSSLIRRARNIVFFDQAFVTESASFVRFDHFEAGRLATEHLLLNGHRNICFAAPPMTREIRHDLFNGYLSALKSFHVPFSPDRVLIPRTEKEESGTEMYDYINGIEMAKHFMQLVPRPTAVFAINDSIAYGMMRCFAEAGIKVPDDVSIIGCDDLNTSEVTMPPLTTIHQPGYETGRLTCQILLDSITGKNTAPTQLVLRPSLVTRASVKML